MIIKSVVKHVIFLFCALGISTSVLAEKTGKNIITVKAGTYSMDNSVQSIFGLGGSATATFENDASTFGIEYDRMMNDNISIGGGYQSYTIDYTTPSGFFRTGDMAVGLITFNSKYHFTTGDFKPFVGATAGFAITDFGGELIGNTAGLALGLMAGFRWQFSTFGLYAEYKAFLSADTEDSGNAEVDLAGDSITAGVSIAF